MATLRQLPKAQTGIPVVDRHLALVTDVLNPLLRSAPLAGASRQFLDPFTVAVPTDWVAATLLNSWVAYDGGSVQSYRKSSNGAVFVRGRVKNGSSATAVIVTLPEEYAPATQMLFGTRGNAAYASLEVDPNGNIFFPDGGSTTDGSICCSFTAADPTPIIPSCFPVDVPHALAGPPMGVFVAQCVDQEDPTDPAGWGALSVQWTPTPGVADSIRVLNIPGLLPTRTYSVTLLAFA